MCKNCGQEFNERDNYNWSCKTHYSEYGGEMWWCCLKKGIRAPGCKSQKHESKDDDDDMDEDGADGVNKNKVKKNARCLCCKELGHEIVDCPRDPNFKAAFLKEEM